MIEIIQDDITTLAVDVIVNAANSSLQRGGGVDGAIHAAAGPELQVFNHSLNGCNEGSAKLAPGFRLPARHIIHTVGPVWRGGGQGESEILASCYQNCLKLAASMGMKQIAFPAISTGIFGYPIQQATEIALTTMLDYESEFDRIIACCFSKADKDIYQQVMTSLRV